MKLSSEPESTIIHHFSHPHPLQLFKYQPQQTLNLLPSCSGCKLNASESMYTCLTCNYSLHLKCSQMPEKITHPFHKNHVFSLLPNPIYPEGFFNCDACNKHGNGFSYHCQACNIDLHTLCASMPLLHSHQSHHHQLKLTFSPPYDNHIFSCDICKTMGSNHWLYRCNSCGFDAHLTCAMTLGTQNAAAAYASQNLTNNFVNNGNPIDSYTAFAMAKSKQEDQIFQQLASNASSTANPIDAYAAFAKAKSKQENQIFQQIASNVSSTANPIDAYAAFAMAKSKQENQLFQQLASNVSSTANPIDAYAAFAMAKSKRENQIFQQIASSVSSTANQLQGLMASAGGQNHLQTLMGGGGGGNPLQALMGGGGGNPLQALMGGGGGGGNPLQALMGGGSGDGDGGNLLQSFISGGGAELLQGVLGGFGGF